MAHRNAGTRLADDLALAMLKAVEASIDGAGDAALAQAIERLGSLTQTNCWWVTYEAAPLLSTLIGDEIRMREEPVPAPESAPETER